jgi:hypothetical protein
MFQLILFKARCSKIKSFPSTESWDSLMYLVVSGLSLLLVGSELEMFADGIFGEFYVKRIRIWRVLVDSSSSISPKRETSSASDSPDE